MSLSANTQMTSKTGTWQSSHCSSQLASIPVGWASKRFHHTVPVTLAQLTLHRSTQLDIRSSQAQQRISTYQHVLCRCTFLWKHGMCSECLALSKQFVNLLGCCIHGILHPTLCEAGDLLGTPQMLRLHVEHSCDHGTQYPGTRGLLYHTSTLLKCRQRDCR